jgi:hypothetical protein
MRIKSFVLSFIVIFFIPLSGFSQTISDYLILQDISSYKLDRPEKLLPGRPPTGGPETLDNPGVVGAADHFSSDHTDKTYIVMYIGGNGLPSPTVQVTQHAGSDSDKWLLHEVERGFRDTDNLEDSPAEDSMIREVDGNKIFFYGGGVVGYRWISGKSVVVNIQYSNLSGPKPEPLEVVKAYLAKFPSIIALTDTDLKSKAHSETWIKDEVDRRLWLCDKWFGQLDIGKVQKTQANQEAVKSMDVFLDYREKYYDIKAGDEKNALAGYLSQNDTDSIKSKLAEYKTWWGENKDKAINLP